MSKETEGPGINEVAQFGEHDAPYRAVFGDVSKIIDTARESAVRSVNAAMTAAYWLVGHRIVEFEQSGEERAEYEAALVERLAEDPAVRTRILQTLFGELAPPNRRQIRQTESGEFGADSAGAFPG